MNPSHCSGTIFDPKLSEPQLIRIPSKLMSAYQLLLISVQDNLLNSIYQLYFWKEIDRTVIHCSGAIFHLQLIISIPSTLIKASSTNWRQTNHATNTGNERLCPLKKWILAAFKHRGCSSSHNCQRGIHPLQSVTHHFFSLLISPIQ